MGTTARSRIGWWQALRVTLATAASVVPTLQCAAVQMIAQTLTYIDAVVATAVIRCKLKG